MPQEQGMPPFYDEVKHIRETNYDIHPLFIARWSPRAMTGESLEKEEFMPLFEAARWAPSSYNNQSWRFIYATRDSKAWDDFLDLLTPGNRKWAEDAAVLVVIASKTTFDYDEKPSRTHSFDTGAAWENLALEGARRGLVVHGMEGFDYDAAQVLVNLPENYEVEAMCAIGRRAAKETLPEDLQDGETPSTRKDLSEIVVEHRFTQ